MTGASNAFPLVRRCQPEVINRYRLNEAVERLAGGDAVDWAQLALDLGVGRPPGEYAR